MKHIKIRIYRLLKTIIASALLVMPIEGITAQKQPLSITWLGTTTLFISDGITGLFFDPFITRPSFKEVATFQKLVSDKPLVKRWLDKIDPNKTTEAIFVSHTHYDHVLDLVEVGKHTNAKVYGSNSAQEILQDGGDGCCEFTTVSPDENAIEIGQFYVTILAGEHAPHIPKINYTALKGEIDSPFVAPSSFWKYKSGPNFNYFIEHPSGNILLHPSGITQLTKTPALPRQADLVIQGIANRESTMNLIDSIFVPFKSKTVIPVHYDNFFEPLSKGPLPMGSVELDEFKSTMNELLPSIEVPAIKYGEEYQYKGATGKPTL